MINLENFKKNNERLFHLQKKVLKIINYFLIKYFKTVVFIIILLIIILGTWLFLWPTYEKTQILVEESRQKQEEFLMQKKRRLQKLQLIVSSYNEINEAEFRKIEKTLPERFNSEELFSEIDHLVSQSNLILLDISIREEKEQEKTSDKNSRLVVSQNKNQDKSKNEEGLPEGVGLIKIDTSILGTNYNSLKSLLKLLENNIPLIDVVQIEFNPNSNITKLVFNTYQLK